MTELSTDPDTATALTDRVAQGLLGAVPFARTVGIEVVTVAPTTAPLRLPDAESLHNHVG